MTNFSFKTVTTALIAGINILSARLATKAAIVFLIAKVSTMAIMIGIGIYNMSSGEFGALSAGWQPTNKSVGDIAVSFYSGTISCKVFSESFAVFTVKDFLNYLHISSQVCGHMMAGIT